MIYKWANGQCTVRYCAALAVDYARKIPLQLPSGEFEVSVVGERPVRTIFTGDHAVMLILAPGDDRPHSNANP